MSKSNPKTDNENIDLTDLFNSLWNNKFQITSITILSNVIGMLFFNNDIPTKNSYNAKTSIQPITTFDELEYLDYNSFIDFVRNNKNQTIKQTIKVDNGVIVVFDDNNSSLNNQVLKKIDKE